MKRKLMFALLLVALLLVLLVPTASAAGGIWGYVWKPGGKRWTQCADCIVLILEGRWQDPDYYCFTYTNFMGVYQCPAPAQTQYLWGYADGGWPGAPYGSQYFWANGAPAWTRQDFYLTY